MAQLILTPTRSQPVPSGTPIVLVLALVKLALHLLTAAQYGYHRDELYYLAASEHPAFGYVDFPPLVPLIAAGTRRLFGDSLTGLHLLPAVAGAAVVILAGLIARRLGGGRFAQGLAALAVLIAPSFLGGDALFTVDPFNVLWWATATYILVLVFGGADQRLWVAFGVVCGIGLMTKVIILYLGAALLGGLALTAQRRHVASRWLWWGGAAALVLCLPYLVWQIVNGWPTLEFYRIYAAGKSYPVTPLEFLGQQVLTMHPLTLPLSVAGLYFYSLSHEGRIFRPLGWMYAFLYAVFTAQQAKFYFLSPLYVMLFAAGAVIIERLTRGRAGWLRPVYVTLLIAGGIAMAPLAVPALPVDTTIRYAQALGLDSASRQERHDTGALPQHFADRFGWEALAASVAGVYGRLPADERPRSCILADNYGEAGAIDRFGPIHGLPKAIGIHNSYHLWGPRDCAGKTMIAVGVDRTILEDLYAEVEPAAKTSCRYCMPYENNLPIYICRHPRRDLIEAWPGLKRFD
jgi:hypothetical protein